MLPVKAQLGEYLAQRVDVGHVEAHVVGSYRDLLIAEVPVRHTPFAGIEGRA